MTKAIITVPNRPALPLGQVLDRPFLQHLIEQLVHRGLASFELLVPKDHKAIFELLGDGTRWGVPIKYLVTEEGSCWNAIAGILPASTEDLVLVGDASRLPFLPELGTDGSLEGPWPSLYFEENSARPHWTGWTLLKQSDLHPFATHLTHDSDWRQALRYASLQARRVFLERPSLSCATHKDLLLSNRTALEGRFPGLFFQGKEVQPGVWVARAVKTPASVRFHAPCYIGEESWIGADCELGPHAVIGPRCVVASGTSVSRSVVGESTYLGLGLEVADCVVQQSNVHNVRLGANIDIQDRNIACNLLSSGQWW